MGCRRRKLCAAGWQISLSSSTSDGRTDAYLADRDSGQPEKIAFPEGLTYFAGNPTPFSPDGSRILVAHQSSKRPSDLWVYELATQKATQLTFSAIAGLTPASLPQSELVHYKSFDGKMISAFLWMPFNLKRDGTTRRGPATRRAHGTDGGLLQSGGGGVRFSWLYLHRSERAWLNRIRPGVSES